MAHTSKAKEVGSRILRPMADPAVDDVLTVDQVAALLKCSTKQIQRLERAKAFPIPRLPALDRKPRYSGELVRRFARGDLQMLRAARKAGAK